jgi:hypothetical protein
MAVLVAPPVPLEEPALDEVAPPPTAPEELVVDGDPDDDCSDVALPACPQATHATESTLPRPRSPYRCTANLSK